MVEEVGGYLYFPKLSTQTAQTTGHKFRYASGRVPPLAFPGGMARQFLFPPNSVMVVFPFKWLQLINNSIYPPKSSLP